MEKVTEILTELNNHWNLNTNIAEQVVKIMKQYSPPEKDPFNSVIELSHKKPVTVGYILLTAIQPQQNLTNKIVTHLNNLEDVRKRAFFTNANQEFLSPKNDIFLYKDENCKTLLHNYWNMYTLCNITEMKHQKTQIEYTYTTMRQHYLEMHSTQTDPNQTEAATEIPKSLVQEFLSMQGKGVESDSAVVTKVLNEWETQSSNVDTLKTQLNSYFTNEHLGTMYDRIQRLFNRKNNNSKINSAICEAIAVYCRMLRMSPTEEQRLELVKQLQNIRRLVSLHINFNERSGSNRGSSSEPTKWKRAKEFFNAHLNGPWVQTGIEMVLLNISGGALLTLFPSETRTKFFRRLMGLPETNPHPNGEVEKTTEDIWQLMQQSYVLAPPGAGEPEMSTLGTVYSYSINKDYKPVMFSSDGKPIDSLRPIDNVDQLAGVLKNVFLGAEYATQHDLIQVATNHKDWFTLLVKVILASIQQQTNAEELQKSFPYFDDRRYLVTRLWKVCSIDLECRRGFASNLKFLVSDFVNYEGAVSETTRSVNQYQSLANKDLQHSSQNSPDKPYDPRFEYILALQQAKQRLTWLTAKVQSCEDLIKIHEQVSSPDTFQRIDNFLKNTPPKTLQNVLRELCDPGVLENSGNQETRRQKAFLLLQFFVDMEKEKEQSSSQVGALQSDQPSYVHGIREIRKAILRSELVTTLSDRINTARRNPDLQNLKNAFKGLLTTVSDVGRDGASLGRSGVNSLLQYFGVDSDSDSDRIATDVQDVLSRVEVRGEDLLQMVNESYAVVPRDEEEHVGLRSFQDLRVKVQQQVITLFGKPDHTAKAHYRMCQEHFAYTVDKFARLLRTWYVATQTTQATDDTLDEETLWEAFVRVKTSGVAEALNQSDMKDCTEAENEIVEFLERRPTQTDIDEVGEKCRQASVSTRYPRRTLRSKSRERKQSRQRERKRYVQNARAQEESSRRRQHRIMELNKEITENTKSIQENTVQLQNIETTLTRLRSQTYSDRTTPHIQARANTRGISPENDIVNLTINLENAYVTKERLKEERHDLRTYAYLLQERLNKEINLEKRMQMRRQHNLEFYQKNDTSPQRKATHVTLPSDTTKFRFGQMDWESWNARVKNGDYRKLPYPECRFGFRDNGLSMTQAWKALYDAQGFREVKGGSKVVKGYPGFGFTLTMFFIKHDMQHHPLRRGPNTPKYILNYCVRRITNGDIIEIGYAGDMNPQKEWRAQGVLPHSLRMAWWENLRIKAKIPSTAFILNYMGHDFNIALEFCHLILGTKCAYPNHFYYWNESGQPLKECVKTTPRVTTQMTTRMPATHRRGGKEGLLATAARTRRHTPNGQALGTRRRNGMRNRAS